MPPALAPIRAHADRLFDITVCLRPFRAQGPRFDSVVSRSDGIVVQSVAGGDMSGYGDDHEVVDRAESERAVGVTGELYARTADMLSVRGTLS